MSYIIISMASTSVFLVVLTAIIARLMNKKYSLIDAVWDFLLICAIGFIIFSFVNDKLPNDSLLSMKSLSILLLLFIAFILSVRQTFKNAPSIENLKTNN